MGKGNWTKWILGFAAVSVLMFALACSEKVVEVIKEVPVEKIVEVEKQVEVEKIVEVEVVKEVVKEVIVVATASPPEVSAVPAAEGNFGGTIIWAEPSSQVTLDVHKTTTGSRLGAHHSQETLFGFNGDMAPRPTLVDTWSASGDGLTHEFKLREGIKFQNGKTFDSTDAVESYKRWLVRDNFGKIVEGMIGDISTVDSNTFTVKLSEPTGLLLDSFARFGGHEAVMMPPEMYKVDPAEGPAPGQMTGFSGTGPYELVEWTPGVHLIWERFSDYKSPPGPFSFRSGARYAYADKLQAIVVPEQSSRIAALEVGQVHFIGGIPGEQRSRIDNNSSLRAYIEPSSVTRWGIWPNHEEGPFSDARVRRALMMAYPVEEALFIIAGSRDLYEACGTLVLCGNSRWGGIRTPGDEIYYGPRDVEGAKALVKEAGVAGEKIVLLSVKGNVQTEGPALVTKGVLEKIGFEVDFRAVDRPTYSETRSNAAVMDLFHTGGGMSWGGISPLLNSSISKDTYWNRYKDPSGQFTAKLEEFARSGSKRQDELVKELQIIFFQDLQYIPIGETRNIVAMTANLQGVTETMKFSNSPNFTNAWLSD